MSCALISQHALALKVIVANASSEEIGVDLVWTGRKSGYTQLKDNTIIIGSKFVYNSNLHHLQALLVKKSDGTDFLYTFEQGVLRGTGTITIVVGWDNDFSKIIVSGYTDMVRQEETTVYFRVKAAEQ